MNRGQILSVLLAIANVSVIAHTLILWRDEPWNISQSLTVAKQVQESPVSRPKNPPVVQVALATNTIVERNLFDPERGQGKADAKEAEALAQAMQKIKDMVLTGTIILGEKRYAILRESAKSSSSSPTSSTRGGSSTFRLKVGDSLEGFQVAQIEDRKVTFTKGATNIDLGLDYFRRIEDFIASASDRPATSPGSPGMAAGLTTSPVRPSSQILPLGPRRTGLPAPPRP